MSNKENAENIKNQVSSLVLHDVKIKSNYYSYLFEEIVNDSLLISDRYLLELEYFLKNKEVFTDGFGPSFKKGLSSILYNDYTYKEIAFMILDNDINGLSNLQKSEIASLLKIRNFLYNIKKYSDHINDIWIVSDNKVVGVSPNIYKGISFSGEQVKIITEKYYAVIKKHKEKIYWTKVYRDVLGKLNLDLITPIYDSDKKYRGIVGVSIKLSSILSEILQDISGIADTNGKSSNIKTAYNCISDSFSFLIDENGNLIAYPPKMAKIFSLPAKHFDEDSYSLMNLGDSNKKQVKELCNTMIENNDGVLSLLLNDKRYIIAFSTLLNSSWTMGVVISEYELFASIRKTTNLVNDTAFKVLLIVFSLALFLLLIFILFNFIFVKRILINPIINLCNDAENIGRGNFDVNIKERKTFEISILSETLNNLGNELKNYMSSLANEIINRQKIETEINVALEVQQSVLPMFSNEFKKDDFFLYVKIFPSEIISGDFYDFFYLDKERTKIALLMADVSSYGVPAAFYMAGAKVILKCGCLENQDDPGKALHKINRTLCMDVETDMNVNALVIFYDMKTGILKYANAAYNEAVVIKNKFVCGLINSSQGAVLGKDMDSVYMMESLQLTEEDKIILFTNGFVKAVADVNLKKYDSRFFDFINFIEMHRSISGKEMSERIEKRVMEKIESKKIIGASVMIFEPKKVRREYRNG